MSGAFSKRHPLVLPWRKSDQRASERRSREALRTHPRRRPRPRILATGVMEFWSTGVLRIVGIAPRVRGVGGAFRATKHDVAIEAPFDRPVRAGLVLGDSQG
jgi:hypothetical protein